jgi:hypothetical protein
MNLGKGIILFAACAMLTGSAMAIPFDNSSGGPAVATVGTGGDYALLSDAAFAFSSVAGGINRPWTLQVISDITETSSTCPFGNDFGIDGSLTIKPAPSQTPTITFTSTVAPLGIFGHVVFGFRFDQVTVTAATSCETNGKFTIDGSNSPGGTTRDLTFRMVGVNSAGNRIIRIWGNNDGVVIKNLNVIYQGDPAGTCEAVALAMGTYTGDTVPLTPDNTLIENCYIESTPLATSGYAISGSTAANGTLPTGNAAQGTIIRNCDLVGKQRVIFGNGYGSTTIENCRLRLLNGTSTAVTYSGIFMFTSNANTGWTCNIRNNVIDSIYAPAATAGQGAYGMLLDTGMVGGTFNISNNILSNLDMSTPSAALDLLLRGISCGDAGTAFNIEHNSIDWFTTATTGATGNRVAGIVFPTARTVASTVQNNIIKFDAAGTNSTVVGINTTANLTFASNNLVRGTQTPLFGYASTGPATYSTLASWQALGFDTAGQSVDPATTTPPWDANKRFSEKPVVGMATVTASTVLTDIDGQARPATGAVPGADEPLQAGVRDWSLQ